MDLLEVYDTEVRGSLVTHPPEGWSCEQDGPLTRCLTARDGFAMLTGDASALSGAELVALVGRTFTHYRDLGLGFEWKTFDHDRPDLRPLLEAAGARPEEHEALVMGEAAPLARAAAGPDGVTVRTVTQHRDLERIAAMESEVWGEDWSWLVDDLARRVHGRDPVDILVAEDGDLVVSAAWLVPVPGTRVAGLWGGSTLPAYRGRGIYRALVARRARIALERGHPFLQVDASADSRPILERLGLSVVGGTVPYAFRP